MYEHDSSQEVLNIRAMFRVLTDLCDQKRQNELSSSNFENLIYIKYEFDDLCTSIVETWKKYYLNPEIIEKSKDNATFNSFINYLKVLDFGVHSPKFAKDYQEGNMDGAQKNLAEMLNRIAKISTESLIETLEPNEALEIIKKPIDISGGIGNLFMGCEPLDIATGGFAKKTLNVFIGATGSGKTALCHNILAKALEEERYVYIACVEDRKESFVRKLMAAMTRIKVEDIKKYHTLGNNDKEKLRKAQEAIDKYLKVHFVYGQSIDSIHKMSLDHDNELRIKGQVDRIPKIHIVDYTYHIASYSFGDKMYEKIRNAYASRKNFALEHDKICIDFAQVNREGVKNLDDDTIITHKDLAGSFDMAQVCDNIISINRSANDRKEDAAKFHTAKSRDGITGVTVRISTDLASMRFRMADWSVVDGGGHHFEKRASDKSA